MKKGIYTASKVRHAGLWKTYRAEGHPVISTWIDEAGEGETKCETDLWVRCVREASSAGVLIVYVERYDTLKGALVEVGAALASGVKVLVVGVIGSSWLAHPLVYQCGSLDEAFTKAGKILETL